MITYINRTRTRSYLLDADPLSYAAELRPELDGVCPRCNVPGLEVRRVPGRNGGWDGLLFQDARARAKDSGIHARSTSRSWPKLYQVQYTHTGPMANDENTTKP